MPRKYASCHALMTIPREVTVAAGRFAPGHLGELTSIVSFPLVDRILDGHGGRERRLRDLPSRVGVYFVLAMCLFPEVGYRLVWGKLVAGLYGVPVVRPSAKALRDLRRRVGIAPIMALFEELRGPLADRQTPGAFYKGYRTVSFDGCTSLRVPDTAANLAFGGEVSHSGYPTLELMTLVETGTRAMLGAVFGPTATGETAYARTLLPLLQRGMLVLWDKGFDSNNFLTEVADTGAGFLGRLRTNRITPVLQRLHDGSYLSVIGGLPVRVIDASITITCRDATSFTGTYRLATTLTDSRRHPAALLVRLYHERWEHESAYFALRHTILGGRVLRSRDGQGLRQEMWALLCLYQALRIAMVRAAASKPLTDPDRCSFTVAIQAAKDLVVQASGVANPPDRIGVIGAHVLNALLPARRARVSTRKVKSPISRYSERQADGRPQTSQPVTALAITVLEPLGPTSLPADTRPDYHGPHLGARFHQVIAVIESDPGRTWTARELAEAIGEITLATMRRQLKRWAEKGHIQRVGRTKFTAQLSNSEEHT